MIFTLLYINVFVKKYDTKNDKIKLLAHIIINGIALLKFHKEKVANTIISVNKTANNAEMAATIPTFKLFLKNMFILKTIMLQNLTNLVKIGIHISKKDETKIVMKKYLISQ